MASSTRREFLQRAAAASAITTLPLGALAASAPSDTVNVGVIGCGWRGKQLVPKFHNLSGVTVAAVCDVDSERAAEAEKEAPGAKVYADLRDLIDAPDIDAVVIGACNHWHCLATIWAMQAGKHVYVEKPLAHTQWEGEQVVAATQRYQRICQVGTQQRSDPMQPQIKKFLHDDKAIGDVQAVRINRFGERKSIGKRDTPMKPPASVNYDLWLGPAQDLPLYRNDFHYDWHWVWNTGSGELGNWGVHIIDDVRNNVFLDKVVAPSTIAAAGGRYVWNDAGETCNVHYALFNAGGIPVVLALSNLPFEKGAAGPVGPKSGYIVYCSNGRLEGQRGSAVAFDADGNKIKQFKGDSGDGHHQQNFIDAVRANDPKLLAAPAEVSHGSSTWCNLINLATRLPAPEGDALLVTQKGTKFGEMSAADILQKLQKNAASGKPMSDLMRLGPVVSYDQATRRFVGEHAAQLNRGLRRNDREPFAVPEIQATTAAG